MTLSTSARTALAHIDKGDKLLREAAALRALADKADRLEAKAEEHYKAAGLIFLKIKQAHDTRTEGPWKDAAKKKCGLAWGDVYRYLRLAEGTQSLIVQRNQTVARVRHHRQGKGALQKAGNAPSPKPGAQLACEADPRIDYQSRMLNLIAEVENIAQEGLDNVSVRTVRNMDLLANAAKRANAKWSKFVARLERLSENEGLKALPGKSTAQPRTVGVAESVRQS